VKRLAPVSRPVIGSQGSCADFPEAPRDNTPPSEEAKALDRVRLNRHIGIMSVPDAVGADNDQIDEDIARSILDTHGEE